MQVAVVVPTYNEAGNIARLVEQIFDATPDAHVLVVDDASPDGTAAVVSQLADSHPQLHLLQRPGKLGLGTAYLAGFKWADEGGFDVVMSMDADFSHDPHDIPRLLARLAARQADLVIGSRYVPGGRISGWRFGRKVLSWGANRLCHLALGLPVRDCTAGFRAYRVSAVLQIGQMMETHGYAALVELLVLLTRAGFEVDEIPVHFANRTVGSSKMAPHDVANGLRTVIRLARADRNARQSVKPQRT